MTSRRKQSVSDVAFWKAFVEHTRWRTGQGLRDARQVGDDRLDAVALSLDLGLESLHLVAVEGVGDILRQVSHGSGKSRRCPLLTLRMLMVAILTEDGSS